MFVFHGEVVLLFVVVPEPFQAGRFEEGVEVGPGAGRRDFRQTIAVNRRAAVGPTKRDVISTKRSAWRNLRPESSAFRA